MSGKDNSSDRLPDSAPSRRELSARAIQALIISGTAVAIGLILFIRWSVPSYDYDESDIGTQTDEQIVATHDFSFAQLENPDINAARKAARDRVRPVWDYDISQQTLIVNRIRPAFYTIRCLLYQEAQSVAAPSGTVEEPSDIEGAGSDESEPAATAADGPTETRDGAIEDRGTGSIVDCGNGDADNVLDTDQRVKIACSATVRANFAQKLNIDGFSESLCAEFASMGFSSDIEASLRESILDLMERQIVSSVAGLQEAGPRGVLLRSMVAGDENSEEVVTNYDHFMEIADVRELARTRELKNAESIQDEDVRAAVREVAARMLQPNTQLNERETRAARESAAGSVVSGTKRVNYHRGQTILPEGATISAKTIEILDQMRATAPQRPAQWLIVLGTIGILALFLAGFLMYSRSQRVRWNTKDLALTATVFVAQTLLTKISILISQRLVESDISVTLDVFIALIPFAAGAMVIRILTRATNALAFTVLYALVVGVMMDLQLIWVAYAVVACTFGAAAVKTATSRTDILRASVLVGASMVAVTICSAMLGTMSVGARPWAVAIAAFSSALTTALVVNALLPLLELTFRYTTPIRLMELASLEHPLLREMLIKAPGTYHHSNMVAQLVEAGCEAVGADTLLGRVGAYYHDIGKMKSPQYFAENQHGENPHDKLKPNMSALIIKSHVKDGVERAKEHNLPPEIIAFIQEHHGRSLIEYFYRRAQDLHPDQVHEDDYRYPGPKPQTRETAICLLADGIEAASRALPEKTEPHIKGLVNRMINRAFIDGQLENCDLTLRDLDAIARAFINRLVAMNHIRPQYPGERKKSDTKKTDAIKAVDGSRDNEPNPREPAHSEKPEPSPDSSQTAEKTSQQSKNDTHEKSDHRDDGGSTGEPGTKKSDAGDDGQSLRRLGL